MSRPLQKPLNTYIPSTLTTLSKIRMISFFQQTAQKMINRPIDRFLPLKINHTIDRQPIILRLHQQKPHHNRE